eukprot:7983639-Pyramimonas_sp.AAC.1
MGLHVQVFVVFVHDSVGYSMLRPDFSSFVPVPGPHMSFVSVSIDVDTLNLSTRIGRTPGLRFVATDFNNVLTEVTRDRNINVDITVITPKDIF